MPYYPLSQVKSNLYTDGKEFVIKSNNSPYTGFYWKTSQGTFYTGKNPNDVTSVEIIPSLGVNLLPDDPFSTLPSPPTSTDVLTSTKMSDITEFYGEAQFGGFSPLDYPKYNSELSRAQPQYVLPRPTTQEYQQGYFTRYFCKKSNEFVYLEIDKDTYDKLKNKDPKILYQLYVPFTLKWQLVGDKEKVYNTNKNIIELVMRDQKMYLLNRYLKENYTQFWKSN